MPKLGMEPMPRRAGESHDWRDRGKRGRGRDGGADRKRAGMSSALAHHYSALRKRFLAAMRQILTVYGAEVRGALPGRRRAAAGAVIRAEFRCRKLPSGRGRGMAQFLGLAQTRHEAKRLLAIYQGRLRSNLITTCGP